MSKRAGVTTKVSVSVKSHDLAMIKRRARRLHGGNVSAVFAELIDEIKRREAWDRAVAWYGKPIELTVVERERLEQELFGEQTTRRSSKGKRAA